MCSEGACLLNANIYSCVNRVVFCCEKMLQENILRLDSGDTGINNGVLMLSGLLSVYAYG